MNIKDIKNFTKVADIVKNNNKKVKKLLSAIWIEDGEILKKENGRIYLITSNGIIKKIGGSNCKGGIKNTINFYLSANTGKPSIRSFGIMMKIIEEIENGNSIEIYVKHTKNLKFIVEGLINKSEETVSISYKYSENMCKKDYFDICKKYPDWNFQENGKKWDLEETYIEYRKRSGK